MDFRSYTGKMLASFLGRAIRLASDAHAGQRSMRGRPYILHPLRVMEAVSDHGMCMMMIAVLHDTIEDTELTLEDLEKNNFPDQVVEAVRVLTYTGEHGNDDDYKEYIYQIGLNEWATIVKIEDLRDNLKAFRLVRVTEKDIQRIDKYLVAYTKLCSKLRGDDIC